MRQEFSLRFEPASGAKFVTAHAYVRALDAALEGLSSLRASIAPELASKHGWPVLQVRDALTFSVGPTSKGSLIVPLIAGGGDKGPQLASDVIAQAFWKEAGAELSRVSKGQASRLSAAGADAFARASAAANASAAKLSFATRTARGTWRALAALTPLEAALRKHAAAERQAHRATTSISGQIVSLSYDPPGFVLLTPSSMRSVRMPSALRDRAIELWGREVVVLTEASVSADGGIADLHALDIRPVAAAQSANENFERTFGIMRGLWDADAVAEHVRPVRH